MEARPKQFRYNLWLRALPVKQLEELGKRESHLRRSRRVIEWYAQAECRVFDPLTKRLVMTQGLSNAKSKITGVCINKSGTDSPIASMAVD